jgi:hypothetical protein
MPTAKARACTILLEFEKAQTELVGKAVILTNGKAGTVDRLWLDDLHGLRISIESLEQNLTDLFSEMDAVDAELNRDPS